MIRWFVQGEDDPLNLAHICYSTGTPPVVGQMVYMIAADGGNERYSVHQVDIRLTLPRSASTSASVQYDVVLTHVR